MVQPEAPSVTTRLQARVDAHEEKLQSLTVEVRELSSTVSSIREALQVLPDSIEKMLANLLKQQGKRPTFDEGYVFTEDSASGHKTSESTHGFNGDDSLFSLPKVQLPLFEGEDPRGWITKAELYFKVHNTPPDHHLKLTQMCMDGSALHWFSNLLSKHPDTSWESFKTKLMIRFSGTRFHNAYEALGSLFQEGEVDEYIDQFEAISALIPNQSEDQSVGLFLRGLKNEIRNWVRTLNPNTCEQAMEYARNIETATGVQGDQGFFKGNPVGGNGSGFNGTGPHHFNRSGPITNKPSTIRYPNISNNRPMLNTDPTAPPKPNSSYTPRHLSRPEWEDRRRKGLCFGCGQRYSPSHKCPEGSLRVILLADGESVGDDGEIYNLESATKIEDGECYMLESFEYLKKTPNDSHLLKLTGEIRGYPILILVDSGATHNFLSKGLALALGLEVKPIQTARINFGGRTQVEIFEQSEQVVVQIGSFSCVIDVLIHEFGSLDLILGVECLKTLGDITFNWETSRITFKHHGTLVHLQGTGTDLEQPTTIMSYSKAKTIGNDSKAATFFELQLGACLFFMEAVLIRNMLTMLTMVSHSPPNKI